MNLVRITERTRRINTWIAIYFTGTAILLAMLLVVVDATGRTLFNFPILGMNEVVRICLAWAAFTGSAYGLIIGIHVRVTLFVERMPARYRFACELLTEFLGATFFTLFFVILVRFFWTSWLIKEIPMGPVPTPIWLAKVALPIGISLIMVEFWLRLIQKLSSLRGGLAKSK